MDGRYARFQSDKAIDREWDGQSLDNIQTYLIPEDGVLLVAAHRQGVTLEAQVHRCIVVPDIWHVLQMERSGRIQNKM